MSTQQQAMVMDTLLALRRTLKRRAYDSDSDSSIDQTTNRGNKLKKRARFVHQGRLASSMGPAAYKEVAELAGYQRAIISRNPPLVDEDGYDIDSDDDEEQVQDAIAAAMDDNPYSSIHLEQILAPLTAVTDLPSHPTLSRPFTSKSLNELIDQGRNLMQKENKALWKAKPLLTKLIGDNTWASCGLMTAPDNADAQLFADTGAFLNRPARRTALPAGPAATGVNGAPKAQEYTATLLAQVGTGPGNTEQNKKADADPADGEILPDANAAETNGEREPESTPKVNGNGPAQDATGSGRDVEMADQPPPAPSRPAAAEEAPRVTLHAAAPGAGPAPGSPDEPFIHPLFLPPASARPERDVGLPEHEAEEVRRLLLLYVQKQEEICRGTQRLYEGLLRADRLRKTVWQWSKAETHCGPNRDMSDGEDWYDKEEWGLTEDLKKGEDEVEEDTAQTQKKTRNRK
ncbi:hypothetical protein C8A05DRAFT_16667 [Staphylotrichum tortipilum]|uniref:Transcriptional regulatory protein RXT2 N-terminal domain-containing protein n=1 Tax=Staphylotrichum tortipilum TaxID=2831512 RepID=A0AAN6MJ00_9PEZI|nr:hypothetical protein C8A05DRAFT_16667 [Staphylotrichum longicolle]